MVTVPVNLEKYLRLLTQLAKLKWMKPDRDDEACENVIDAADRAWLCMTDDEHTMADFYVALHIRHITKEPPDYSPELVQEVCQLYKPRLTEYLLMATAALKARWFDQQMRAKGKESNTEQESTAKLSGLWLALDDYERMVVLEYTARYFTPCLNKEGGMNRDVPCYIPYRELVSRLEIPE